MYYWLLWVETGTVSSCQVVGTGSLVFVSLRQVHVHVAGTGSLVSVAFTYHVYILVDLLLKGFVLLNMINSACPVVNLLVTMNDNTLTTRLGSPHHACH